MHLSRLRLVARLCYAAWGLAALVVCIILVTARGGHPPAIVFLPAAVAVWVVGQLTLWVSFRLIVQGQAWSPDAPPSWWLAVVGCIVISFLGLVFAGNVLLDRDRAWNTWNLILLAIWAPHAVCLPGLLLRRSWGKRMAALLAAGWSLLMGAQIVEHLVRDRTVYPGELLFALTVVAGFALLSWRLAKIR